MFYAKSKLIFMKEHDFQSRRLANLGSFADKTGNCGKKVLLRFCAGSNALYAK